MLLHGPLERGRGRVEIPPRCLEQTTAASTEREGPRRRSGTPGTLEPLDDTLRACDVSDTDGSLHEIAADAGPQRMHGT